MACSNGTIDHPEVLTALQQSQTRIHTIAAIHHLLYGSAPSFDVQRDVSISEQEILAS